MTFGHPRMKLRTGREVLLVKPDDLQWWSSATAKQALLTALREGIGGTELRSWADRGGYFGDLYDDEAVAAWFGERIERRQLVPLALPRGPIGMPLFDRDAIVDPWANAVPLSSLSEEPVEELGWVSIEVLDYRGVAFSGLELTLIHCDGQRDRIVLDGLGRFTAKRIAVPGPTMVRWPASLETSEEQRKKPSIEGFSPSPGDISVRRAPAGVPSALPAVNTHYRVVVAAPPKQRTLSFLGAVFGFGSACPTAGVADLVTIAAESAAAAPEAMLGVFGHTDEVGSEAANKLLSDRRADIAYSLVCGDFELFCAVAAEEGWGVVELQSLLRSIGCNPGAIDGDAGALTAAAVREFRRNYNAGFFHRSRPRSPLYAPLADADSMDEDFRHALLDAFHAQYASALPKSRFLGPARSGCGEFNRSHAPQHDRRVSLVVYGDDAPANTAFPCVRGDATACAVQGPGPVRCEFYREHIGAEEDIEGSITYWDFEWLPTPSGNVHLSALTSLPDTNEAVVSVQLVPGGEQQTDEGSGEIPPRGREIAKVPGLIRRGVIYGLWSPPPGYDPFRARDWFRMVDEAEGDPWQPRFRPPVFAVHANGRWGFGAAPGHRADRLAFAEEPSWPIAALLNDGRIVLVPDQAAMDSLGTMHMNGALFAAKGSE